MDSIPWVRCASGNVIIITLLLLLPLWIFISNYEYVWHWTAFTIHKQNDKKWRQKDSVKKWCEAKRNDVKQKEMMWNKKKWCETKRNDVKQKEMTRNKKKWREAIAHDVSPVAMFV